MNEMRAAQYDAYGPPEVLRVRTVAVPSLRPGHVLVRVAASSLNGADIAVRSGKLKLVTGRKFPRGPGSTSPTRSPRTLPTSQAWRQGTRCGVSWTEPATPTSV